MMNYLLCDMKKVTVALGLSGLLLMYFSVVLGQSYPDNFDKTFSSESLPMMLMSGDDNAIVRLDEHIFEVKSIGKATSRIHRAITILNEKARDQGELVVWYDKLRKIKKLEGVVRNENGKVVKKLGKGDIEDYSAISGYSLYEDSRVRVASLYHNQYPYTVEFTVELERDGLLSWPTWEPLEDGLPLEFGQFVVKVPEGMPVRQKSEGMDLEPAVSKEGKKDVYRWELSYQHMVKDLLLAAVEDADVVPAADEVTIYTAPEQFEIEGSKGDMRAWSSFGHWYYSLSLGRDVLPSHIKERVNQITQGIDDPVEKVRRIYDDFQSSTRYVSVQLGLGGWQPFDANYVAENGYGDCKALTNYLYALLKHAGITSYPALIRSGRGAKDILEDFPSSQFNHVVLMVPIPSDTLWLEATDQTAPFNHLGASNEDRFALKVGPTGGELVRTPQTSSSRNQRVRHSDVKLTASGNATATVDVKYAGNRQDYVRYNLVQASGRDQMEWLRETINIPSFNVIEADFSGVQGRIEEVSIPYSLELPRYASKTGKRLFVPTNLLRTTVSVPVEEDIPSNPVKLSYAYQDQEEVRFQLPAGYNIEAMPDDVLLETPFAMYSATHEVDSEGNLLYQRTLEFKNRVIQPALYGEYRDFLSKVAKSDRSQVVLVSN